MELAASVTSAALLIAGSIFAVIGGIGLLRLPDFFSRIHGAGVTDTAGAGLVLAGLMLHSGLSLATVKLALILLFLWITGPTAMHALAKAALESGIKPRVADEEGVPSSP